MLTLDQKIRKWSRKVNRNKTFTSIEMEEMEDHLLMEIKQMVEYDKLTEDVAFKKATETLGEQGILDVEYGKIRWSAFFKVKLWAYLQTFIILGLVMFLVVPYVNFPKKNRNGFIVGKEIGEISQWAYEGSKNSSDSYVTYKNQTYFYSKEQKNLLCYQYSPHDFNGISLFLTNPYFISTPYCSCLSPFDIDSNNDFFMMDDYDNSITVYRKAKKVKNIKLPKDRMNDRFVNMKVIGKKIIVCLTVSETKNLEAENVFKKNDVYSNLLIYDLLSAQQKWEIVKLKKIVLSMNRSEDELAFLYIDGNIDVFTFQNQKLTMIDTRKIIDFASFLANHRTKTEDSFKTKITTKLRNLKRSLLSVFTPEPSRTWKLGSWEDLEKQNKNPLRSSFANLVTKIKTWKIFGNHPKSASFVAAKFHLIGSHTEPSNDTPWKDTPNMVWWGRTGLLMPNSRLAKDPSIPTINIPATPENLFFTRPILWKLYKDTEEPWYVILDDAGQLWFDPDGRFNDPRYNAKADMNDPIFFKTIDHTYSDCHISLLFSKKNHQMVLVEKKNSNRFSYLVPHGKELKILPLTDKDIAGVMKVNFIDPERLVLVKETNSKIPTELYGLYLFKD